MIITDQIYSALFTLLQGAYTWNYSSRRLLPWDNVTPGQQPAMFIRELSEDVDQSPHGLYRRRLRAQIWIYAQAAPNADDPGNYPAQTFNPILDAIYSALMGPVPGMKQTLADYNTQNPGTPLVENVWISGKILMDDPVAPDQQIVIVIPVEMTTGI